jgi:mRNA interferase MazF
MTEGDILLALLPQATSIGKVRPALFLRRMPPFNDFLVCGVSTQLRQAVVDFDELIERSDPDFETSGLKEASLIRLGFLAVIPPSHFKGRIGKISTERLNRVLTRLAEFLRPQH